jgi:hypothetical protein
MTRRGERLRLSQADGELRTFAPRCGGRILEERR